MKRILFFSPTGGHAGIDVCLDNLVSNIDKEKYEPIIVFPHNAYLKKKFINEGIECYELPLEWWFPTGFTGTDFLAIAEKMRPNIDALVHIIKKKKVDLIFSNTTVSLDACIAGLLAHVPHVFYMHAQFVDNIYIYMRPQTREMIYRFMGAASSKIICCSETLYNKMKAIVPNAVYINNGINTNEFKFEQKTMDSKVNNMLNMICIGHFNPNKQQDFVLEALCELKKENRDLFDRVHFTAIGPSEPGYLNELKDYVKKNRLNACVTFEDFEKNVAKRLKQYDVYVNSSITETLPLSVMEGMSSGLPALVTPTDGGKLIVRDGIDGFVCHTPREMAKRIIEMLEQPGLIEQLSRNARQRIEEAFSIERMVAGFEQLFDIVLKEECSISEGFRRTVYQVYESLTVNARIKGAPICVLTVYPTAAMPTFEIAAKKPLEYLEERGLIKNSFIPLELLKQEDLDRADVVYCIRFYHDQAYELLRNVKKAHKPFIWYIDDNYNAVTFVDGEPVHKPTKNDYYERMFRDSDYVIVNNHEIFKIGRALNQNIACLPTYQSLTHFDFESSKSKSVVRFGFMGTLKRDGDFDCVEKAILRILDEYGSQVEVEFIGYYPNSLENHPQVKHFEFMYDYEEFRRFFESREWDFAIAPLKDTLFNRSKTNNKYREYSSLRIPAVFSNISAYRECVKHEENGLLTDNTESAWFTAIKRMITNRALREKLGKAAFEDIKNNYGIDRYAEPLFEIIEDCYWERSGLVYSENNKQATEERIEDKKENALYIERKPVSLYDFYHRLRKTEAKPALQQMNPAALSMCYSWIPGLKNKHICLSDPIPYNTYIEYNNIDGFGGNTLEFILVGKIGATCIVEVVADGQIVYNGLINVNSWMLHTVRVTAIQGVACIRFRTLNPSDVVKCVEYIERKGIFGKKCLFGWII